MPIHNEPSELAGQTVTVNFHEDGTTKALEYRIEDWWDRVGGGPWGDANGNPAAMQYGIRAGFASLPWDDEVLYGKIGHFGYLVHRSEVLA
jgi:hypothetical protein